MEKSIILQLSQSESYDVTKNGQYRTIITKQEKLEEGDILTVKNAFLDTTNLVQNKINIEKDIDLHLSIVKYNINFDTTNKTYYENTAQFKPDGMPYLSCNFFSTGPDPGGGVSELYQYVEKIQFVASDPAIGWGETKWEFRYLDMHSGQESHVTFNIPIQQSTEPMFEIKDLKIAIRKDSFIALTPNGTKNTKLSTVIFGDMPAQLNIISPLITKKIVQIDKGNYDPSSLALIITKALVNNANDTNFVGLVDNPFLTTSNSLVADYIFLRSDGTEGYTFAAQNYWVGASQIELLFDSAGTNKFFWNYIHFPYYDAAGTAIATGYLQNGLGNNFVVSAHGGAFFTGLTAFSRGSTTDSFDFWEGKMGFDVTDLCVDISHTTGITIGGVSFTSAPTCFLRAGQNITSGFTGIDTAVLKGGTVYQEPAVPVKSTISDTEQIFAKNSVDVINLSNSHFILEIEGNFQNDFRNSNQIIKTVSSIISRYYGYENFTSAEQASIQYIHKGEPVYIKSLRVRVLNPDLSEADLGAKNHVYVEIIKRQ